MNFVFMFVVSWVALIITRVLFVLLWRWYDKKRKTKKGKECKVKKVRKTKKGKECKIIKKLVGLANVFSPIAFSLIAFLAFLVFWGIAILIYLKIKQVNDNLFFYVIFTFYGLAAIIWCYCRWDFKKGARLRFENDKIVMSLKKTLVFSAVMVFAFCYGYSQLNALLNKGAEVNNELAVYNATMISGMIALDRVLNQVSSVYNGRKDVTKEQKEG